MPKFPAPQQVDPLVARVAQCERILAALVDLASPEQLRKALASQAARASASAVAAQVQAGLLEAVLQCDKARVVQFAELRGEEVVTPSVYLDMSAATPDARSIFAGEGTTRGRLVGETFEVKDGVTIKVLGAWRDVDVKAVARMAKAGKGKRGR